MFGEWPLRIVFGQKKDITSGDVILLYVIVCVFHINPFVASLGYIKGSYV